MYLMVSRIDERSKTTRHGQQWVLVLARMCVLTRPYRPGTASQTIGRIFETLSICDTDPVHVMALLRTTRSIVSGSAALLMVTDLEFVPGDLDIYTPLSQEEPAMAIVQRHMNFELVTSRMPRGLPRQLRNHEGSPPREGGEGEDPAIAIFHFHSTIVMNYLTGFGLYCAYPSLTLSDVGVVNLPAVLRELGIRRNAEECFDKYRARGITLVNDVKKLWRHSLHECRRDAECPHTIRSTLDARGLYVALFQPTDAEDEYIARNRYATIWMLGGPMCGETGT
ncbi:hypothetical protein C8F04DRAFT_1199167 [Mycena alexandri]|uniref:Uncharacterized protein n=1 Tax=Mycena alexandri TaxID=1745969 RepID=A0AAD6RZK5_9AGAR|nr:hypothetical protein C8F04DRAFT_1199167 [Mycena alexandri]